MPHRHKKKSSLCCEVSEAVAALEAGEMIVLIDDEESDANGSVIAPADSITSDQISFMMREARGLVSLGVTSTRADALNLTPMGEDAPSNKAFTVSINAREGLNSGGASARDRAHSIRVAVGPDTIPNDLVRPGQVFPIRAKDGGVLVRAGVAEAGVDLARMAGRRPAAVTCELMTPEGELAELGDIKKFAEHHGLKFCSIESVIEHRMQSERIIERVAFTRMPTQFGFFMAAVYRSKVDGKEHIALCHNVKPRDLWDENDRDYSDEPVLVRVHSECLTGDALGSMRCDCGGQLAVALEKITAAERGALLYMRQEGRGIGLANKLRAYELQDEGYDTVQANHMLGMKADQREYGTGAQMLRDLGINKMLLMSNNPRKFTGLHGYHLEIVDRVPIELKPNAENKKYLRDKRDKMGHMLKLSDDSGRLKPVSN